MHTVLVHLRFVLARYKTRPRSIRNREASITQTHRQRVRAQMPREEGHRCKRLAGGDGGLTYVTPFNSSSGTFYSLVAAPSNSFLVSEYCTIALNPKNRMNPSGTCKVSSSGVRAFKIWNHTSCWGYTWGAKRTDNMSRTFSFRISPLFLLSPCCAFRVSRACPSLFYSFGDNSRLFILPKSRLGLSNTFWTSVGCWWRWTILSYWSCMILSKTTGDTSSTASL